MLCDSQLVECGFDSVEEVLRLSPLALAKEMNISNDEALLLQRSLRSSQSQSGDLSLCNNQPAINQQNQGKSALDLLRQHRQSQPITTMCNTIDELLDGGIAFQQITEICGVPGIGKTQFGMQLACSVQIPEFANGIGGAAVYIDTEGSFTAERAYMIAEGVVAHVQEQMQETDDMNDTDKQAQLANFTARSILKNIHCYRLYDYVEQVACVHGLKEYILKQNSICQGQLIPSSSTSSSQMTSTPSQSQSDKRPIRCIIMDSVAFHFRRGFTDMGHRTRILTNMSQQLYQIATDCDVAIVLINQVTTRLGKPSVTSTASTGYNANVGAHLSAALGDSFANSCTNRIMLSWNNGQREAALIKSSSLPCLKTFYTISSDGIRSYDQLGLSNVDLDTVKENIDNGSELNEIRTAPSALNTPWSNVNPSKDKDTTTKENDTTVTSNSKRQRLC